MTDQTPQEQETVKHDEPVVISPAEPVDPAPAPEPTPADNTPVIADSSEAPASPIPPEQATTTPGSAAPLSDAPARAQAPVQPVTVDNRTRRDDSDGLEGHFVRVKNGDHTGRVGVFLQTLQFGQDGYPERILFRSRDADNVLLDVKYADVEACHETYAGGR